MSTESMLAHIKNVSSAPLLDQVEDEERRIVA